MAVATIWNTFFHPQHILTSYHYNQAWMCPRAACECVITGMGYRCGLCNFNIHAACLSLPQHISFGRHRLTLTLLGGSRWCDFCRETSHAWRYAYLCGTCNFGMHPRCLFLIARPEPQPPPPSERSARRRNQYGPSFLIRMGLQAAHLMLFPQHAAFLAAYWFTSDLRAHADYSANSFGFFLMRDETTLVTSTHVDTIIGICKIKVSPPNKYR
ncbi:unnamed protein product [Urochloa humidicola]